MNDFLSNLAAKSLNLTEMVQPRLTMLFEPSQSSIWPTPAADNGVETIDGEYSTVQGEIGTSSILKPVARHPADSSFLEVKPEMSQINIDRQNSSLSFKSAGKNPVISPGETGQESDRLVLPETLKPMVNIGDFQSVKNQRWYSPASEEAETKPEAQSAKRTKNQQGDQKEEPSGGLIAVRNEITLQQVLNTVKTIERQPFPQHNMKSKVEKQVVSTEIRPLIDIEEKPIAGSFPETTSSSTLIVQPPVSLAQQMVPTPKSPRETPPVSPTINVTIGRIEVRATPSPVSKPRKQRSLPPAMSLDEYLQKRSKGGRE